MTVTELMHHNFDEIFIELDPVKREAMMLNSYTEDCVWIHPGWPPGRHCGRSMRQRRKFVSASRNTVKQGGWRYSHDAQCRDVPLGAADFLANRSAIPVRTFWRNATAVLLCFTPSSIVGTPPVSSREPRPLPGWKTWRTRISAVRYCRTTVRTRQSGLIRCRQRMDND